MHCYLQGERTLNYKRLTIVMKFQNEKKTYLDYQLSAENRDKCFFSGFKEIMTKYRISNINICKAVSRKLHCQLKPVSSLSVDNSYIEHIYMLYDCRAVKC